MYVNKLTVIPSLLQHIPQPPEQLYHCGAPLKDLLVRPRLAIVGSRKVSSYGRQITSELAKQAAEQGIVIVSGLALGVDSIAHEAALKAGGSCIAVLPSPIEHIVPRTNVRLAGRILAQGGALVSEYPAGAPAYKNNFVERNRLMSGLADAVLITEAALRSGSLHTANFAGEQGKALLAVPGNITNPLSVGTNNLIKAGAICVTDIRDILFAMKLQRKVTTPLVPKGSNPAEQAVLDLLTQGLSDADELLDKSQLAANLFNQTLTMLEITGKIKPLGANRWAVNR